MPESSPRHGFSIIGEREEIEVKHLDWISIINTQFLVITFDPTPKTQGLTQPLTSVLCLLVTYTACSANMFGANLTGLTLDFIRGILFSIRTPRLLQKRSKSLSDRQWMLGELCHWKGSCRVSGARPPNRSCSLHHQ